MSNPPPPRFCTECGTPLPSEAKFCSQCGTRVAPPEAPPQEAPAAPAIQQPPGPVEPPIPAELREKFEKARAELRGQRREVVVLFADVSGYTALSERLDPEEVTVLMQGLLGELAAAVFRYEGYVDKYIGDAIMALFGAPIAHENDPERAVLAALEMLQVTARRRSAEAHPISLRVGLNLGEVVAGHIGTEQRQEYTVMGDAVNVASRLESAAAPDSILISRSVHERIMVRFEVEEVPPLTVKGKTEPLRAFRVLRYRPAAEVIPRTATAFVGREEELAALEAFFARVARGKAGPLVIEADAGVGKSRLLKEALARTDVGLSTVRIEFSPIQLPGRHSVPSELFRQLVPLVDSAGPAEPEELAERALAVLGTAADEHRAGIEGLALRSVGGGALEGEEPQVARQNRWFALTALITAASRVRPILLVFEDVHWTDEAGQEFLGFLLPAVAGQPAGVLLTAREGATWPWLPPSTERLALRRLDQGNVRSILGDLFDTLPPAVRRELMRRSQGNPLYLEELARSLSESVEAMTASVPSTLQGLLQSRIDRLPPPVQLLLEMAAVLGPRFPVPLLAGMYRLESQAVEFQSALDSLKSGGFVEPLEEGLAECRFGHDLMREVAYSRLLVRVRKVLHESAARLGEEYYGDRREAEAPFFAHHYWEAGLPAEAAPHLWQAGRAASRNYELFSAEGFLQRLAGVVEKDPAVLGSPEDVAQLQEVYGTVLLQRGQLNEATGWFVRLQELGEREGRPEWTALGLRYQGQVAWYRGRLDEAQALYERGLATIRPEDERIAADLHNGLACVHFYRESTEPALEHFEQGLLLRRRLDDKPGVARILSNIGSLLLDLREDLAGAEGYFLQAHELAEQVEDRQLNASMLTNLGRVAMEKGEWRRALARYRRVEQQAERIGWAFLQYLSLRNQGYCHLRLGQISGALRCLRTCIEKGDDVLEPVNRVAARLMLFEAYLDAMAYEEARAALEEAREVAERLEVTDQREDVLIAEGRWLAVTGDWPGAASAFTQAVKTARSSNHLANEDVAHAYYSRAAARAGLEEDGGAPAEGRGRSGNPATLPLLTYLAADTAASRSPSPEAARGLGEAGVLAAERGALGLERAAFEHQAEVWAALGDQTAAEQALARAARAMAALERNLPEELRDGFVAHPRNAALREFVSV